MEVKWIKIVTNIFDDEKVRYIESLPNGDETIVIWFRILCLAGKSNSGGLLMMTDRIAYTDEMLASIFQRDIKSIQLALNIFENLEMIERIDNKIYLTNWEKHQSLDALEKKKIYDKEYQKKKRNEKLIANKSYDNRTTIVENRITELELEEDIDKELKNKDIKPKKHVYGEFKNVKLTDDEYKKLEEKGLLNDIEKLSSYIESKGVRYKSHYATILVWNSKNKGSVKDKIVEIPTYYNQIDDESEKQEALRKLREME